MICLYRAKSAPRSLKADTFQDPKSFGEHIREFLEGNHTINDSLEGSFDFVSESEVDFTKPLPPSNPNLYDVACGQEKVFPEPVITSDLTNPSPDPASAPEVSSE